MPVAALYSAGIVPCRISYRHYRGMDNYCISQGNGKLYVYAGEHGTKKKTTPHAHAEVILKRNVCIATYVRSGVGFLSQILNKNVCFVLLGFSVPSPVWVSK